MSNYFKKNFLARLGRLGCRAVWRSFGWLGIGLGLCSLTAPAQSTYEPYTFTTLAGLAGTPGSTDGTGSDARFKGPSAAAVDDVGNIYVAEAGNNMIRKVSPAGTVTTLAGQAGTLGSANGTGSAARFNTPQGLAVDKAGNVYVADNLNSTIRKVTPAGAVTTLAGLAGSSSDADGVGSDARFRSPVGVAADSAGNIYVADSDQATIRKVTPAGVVSTLAGLAGDVGSTDGAGSAARFLNPWGVAVDSAGNVYVADAGNNTIRKVSPAGMVTTLAGLARRSGSADGTGNAARFNQPMGVAVDKAGNVYVADYWNSTIRKVTPAGGVTTLAGLAESPGSTDGTGSAVRFNLPAGLAMDNAGNLYVADMPNNAIRRGWPTESRPPAFIQGPASHAVVAGSNVTFTVSATGAPSLYQWLWNGQPLLGQTNATLTLSNVQPSQLGLYAVIVSNDFGATTSPAASLGVILPPSVVAEFRAALVAGGLVKWEKDGIIALQETMLIDHDTVLDGTGHSVVISGQNQVRAFLVNSNAHLALVSITVADGLANQGGGIYNDGGSVSLSNCVFTNNQAVGDYTNRLDARGGAICSFGGSIAATNSLFATNAAIRGRLGPFPSDPPFGPLPETLALEARGGVLAAQDGILSLMNCQFTANQAAGGMYDTGRVIPGGQKGSAFGGAIFTTNSVGEVSGCRFDHNLAQSPEQVSYVGLDSGADVLGGALHQEGAGQLHLLDCAFEDNQALGGDCGRDGRIGNGRGGAVSSYGNLVADRCSFHRNACLGGRGNVNLGANAFGGALFTTNTATLQDCLFAANWAHATAAWYGLDGSAYGGAVYAQGVLQILNTTFVSNWVEGVNLIMVPMTPAPGNNAGGALYSVAVCGATNSTWFQNHADAQTRSRTDGRLDSEGAVAGAAIYQTGNSLTLVHCTIAGNSIVSVTNTGAAIAVVSNAIAQLSACLLAGNTNTNLAGSIVDDGFNLSSDHSVLLTAAGSRNDVDAKLGDFGDHGGPTPTLALLPGSPAIDAVTSGACPDTDQRGVVRPIGLRCDIGAFEFVPNLALNWDSAAGFRAQELLPPARDYEIDVSTNLADWTSFATNRTDELGILKFTDNTVTNTPYRFYRVVPK